MPNRSRLSIAKPKIENFFDQNDKRIYSRHDLQTILNEHSLEWRLASTTNAKKFIEYLIKSSYLTIESVDFSDYPKVYRFIWKKDNSVSPYEIALSLKSKSYLSHYTAMFLNDLTEQIPKNIYVTFEQAPKRNTDRILEQESIDIAFKKPIRRTTSIATYANYKITLLNGQFTARTGVVDLPGPSGRMLRVTNKERTLIDAAVRPEYCGGVHEVLKAFEMAQGEISVNKLKAYLKNLNFIYPYHQVIGFYLELAGYPEKRLQLFEKEPIEFDFYLAHEMNDVQYSKRWKLYYPASFSQ